jgi:hypothetical protein
MHRPQMKARKSWMNFSRTLTNDSRTLVSLRPRRCPVCVGLMNSKCQTQHRCFINVVWKPRKYLSIFSNNLRQPQKGTNQVSITTMTSKQDGGNVRTTQPLRRGRCIDASTDILAMSLFFNGSTLGYAFEDSSSHTERYSCLQESRFLTGFQGARPSNVSLFGKGSSTNGRRIRKSWILCSPAYTHFPAYVRSK